MIHHDVTPAFLAYIRTGAYWTTLVASSHERAELPDAPWPSDADMEASLDAHHGTALSKSQPAIVTRSQPSHAGSVLGGVRST